MLRGSAHCDYWRATRSGMFFLLRGYDEDSIDEVEPGTLFQRTILLHSAGYSVDDPIAPRNDLLESD
jgi:hypothetical protein